GLVVVNPAGLVVRVNTERAATGEGPGFDVAYGTSALGTDAVPALVDAVERLPPREACRVAAFLLDDPAARSEGGWRSWTVSRWRARRAVSAHETELRAIACPEP
ncbi:MAG: hypothetical protein R3326_08495, partial [Gemmatimonadota bacterium]|nr:hypothetical protein [Gemmatimonadota bacterium]